MALALRDFNPFRPPPREESGVRRRLADLIYGDRQPAVDRAMAVEMLNWMGMPYHQNHLEWLKSEADRPVPVADHANMISLTARANTFKEILQHLRNSERSARRILGDEDE